MSVDSDATAEVTRRARVLWDDWEVQQAAYVAQRDVRFEVMLDLVADLVAPDGAVLDLACGAGAISARVLERFPGVRCVAVDVDPVLLELGRCALAPHGERVGFVRADLADPAWADSLPEQEFGAVLSSTALHWLTADVLARVYADVAGMLVPGGFVANADHLRFDATMYRSVGIAERHDRSTQEEAFAAGAPTWADWWDRVAADDHFAPLIAERDRTFADRPAPDAVGLGVHVEAMRAAGLREAGPLWQLFDDYIVVAHR